MPGRLSAVSFVAGPGEVVGMVGLEGAGHLCVLEVICGRTATTAGTVRILGRRGPRSLREAIGSGIAFVSSDRKRCGLMLDDPVWLNVAAVRWLGLGRGRGLLDVGALVAAADRHRRRLRIRGDARRAP